MPRMTSGKSHRHQPVHPEFPLTPREREVVILVAEGLSNREIADALVVSLRTAEVHVSNALAKLGLRSRSQLALSAVDRGLTDPIRR